MFGVCSHGDPEPLAVPISSSSSDNFKPPVLLGVDPRSGVVLRDSLLWTPSGDVACGDDCSPADGTVVSVVGGDVVVSPPLFVVVSLDELSGFNQSNKPRFIRLRVLEK